MTRVRHPVPVLLVEDNPDDVDLLRMSLQRAHARCVLTVASNGDEALARLREPPDGRRARLVLLDLNMPGRSGRDVLREIRADPELAKIPVIVLSSSDYPDDVETLYRLGASCYLLKPADLAEFRLLAERLDTFWLGTALIPD